MSLQPHTRHLRCLSPFQPHNLWDWHDGFPFTDRGSEVKLNYHPGCELRLGWYPGGSLAEAGKSTQRHIQFLLT